MNYTIGVLLCLDSLLNFMYEIHWAFCFVLFIFKTGFLCTALAVLEFTVDQAGLKLKDQPASASLVLGLKACTIIND